MAADDPERRNAGSRLDLVPAVAKLAAAAWWHAAERGVGVSLRIGSRIVSAAVPGRDQLGD